MVCFGFEGKGQWNAHGSTAGPGKGAVLLALSNSAPPTQAAVLEVIQA